MAKRALFLMLLVCGWGYAERAWPQAKNAAAAKTKKIKLALLPLSVKALDPEVAKKLGATVIAELGEFGIFDVVPGKTLSAQLQALKAKKVYDKNCEEQKNCLLAVGRGLAVPTLYHLRVAKAQEGVTLTMRAFDAKTGGETKVATEYAKEEEADLERAARWVTRKVVSPVLTATLKGKGKIQISCEEAGADVYVNGKSFGKKIGSSFKVTSGVFEIAVKKEGYTDYQDVVVVKPDQVVAVTAVLKAIGQAKPVVVDAGQETPKTGTETAGSGGSSAVSTGLPPPIEPKDPTKEVKPGEKKEVPPWAAYEQPKTGSAGPKDGAATPEKSGEAPVAVKTPPKPQEPFLPLKEQPPATPEDPSKSEKRFYQTWWFWTVVGVVVAGGGATGAYFALSGGGGGEGGKGSAVVSWQ